MSCEDRLVNRNCIRKHKIRKAEDDSDVDTGGSGSSSGDGDGDDGVEAEMDGVEASENDDGRVCCLIKGEKKPRLIDECSEKEGDKVVNPMKCVRLPGSDKDDSEKEDKDKDEKQRDEGGKDSVEDVEKEQDHVQDEKPVTDNSADNKKKGGKKCCRYGKSNTYQKHKECRKGYSEVDQRKCRRSNS